MEETEERTLPESRGAAARRKEDPIAPEGPEIGETKVFIPHALWMSNLGNSLQSYGRGGEIFVTGVCCYVSRDHRLARYEYDQPGGGKGYECFKY